jgi:hypothetical protein
MKPKSQPEVPPVSISEIEQSMRKSETVQIRVTPVEKAAIVKAKDTLNLTTTEYLVRCHELVAAKLRMK